MKTMIWLGVLFAAMLLFLPDSGSSIPRNLPLLLVICALFLLYAAVMLARRVILLGRTVRLLEGQGFVITRRRIAPTGSYILAKMAGETVCIRLLIRSRPYLRYHFETPTRIELYRTGGTTVRLSSRGTLSRGAIEERCVRKKRFTAQKADRTVFLFDKLPRRVTDTVSRHELAPGGPVLTDTIRLYDRASFAEAVASLPMKPGGTL